MTEKNQERMRIHDEEDHNPLFGSMYDDEIPLTIQKYTYLETDFSIKSAHLYYGKVSKFMPLTVWPACPSFLEMLISVFGNYQKENHSNPTNSLTSKHIDGLISSKAGEPMLEIGAGTGMLSIVLTKLFPGRFPKAVTSDCRSSSLDIMKSNADLNEIELGKNLEVRELTWCESPNSETVDDCHRDTYSVVFGTDVLFSKESIPLLVKTVKYVMKKGGVCVLANHICRIDNIEDWLFRSCEKEGMRVEMVGFCSEDKMIKIHTIQHAEVEE